MKIMITFKRVLSGGGSGLGLKLGIKYVFVPFCVLVCICICICVLSDLLMSEDDDNFLKRVLSGPVVTEGSDLISVLVLVFVFVFVFVFNSCFSLLRSAQLE